MLCHNAASLIFIFLPVWLDSDLVQTREVIAVYTARCRLLFLLVLPAIWMLGGCSGSGSESPALIPGDFFPLPVGTVWEYTTVLEAETETAEFSTTGTMTRTLLGQETISVFGEDLEVYVFQHDYTAAAVPPDFGGASTEVMPFIRHLFSDPGGLQSVRAYYWDAPAQGSLPSRVELVALSLVDGPIVPVAHPRPYLLTPTYDGTELTATSWFVPLPLMPLVSNLENLLVREKLLDYGDVTGPSGGRRAVVSIYTFASRLDIGTDIAPLGGRGRSFFRDGVGLCGAVELSDWYGFIDVGSATGRVTSRSTLVSVETPSAD